MGKPNVATVIVDALVAQGVKRIYGVCGDSLNGITEAIRTNKAIDWVHTRHEETAAFAAGAEAHLTGNLTVCAGSCGPGNLHLINGLYDCHRSRVPVLAIAAQINTGEMGSGYFQETHPEHLFAQCSHYVAVVSDPSQMPRLLKLAMQHAIAQQGVAVLVLPGDIALKEVQDFQPTKPNVRPTFTVCPSEPDLDRLASLLNSSQKTTIFAGAGCANAHEELIGLARKLQAPIVHTMRGKEFVEFDNPFDVGMTGLLGFTSGYRAMMNCDTLILVGTDFPYRQFYPPHAKVAQIDIRGEQIGRRCKVDVAAIGDVKTTLSALLPKLTSDHKDKHLKDSLQHYQKARAGLDKQAEGDSIGDTIHPQYLTQTISNRASEKTIFTCDVGTPTVWAARYLRMTPHRRLIGSFVHGSMANALPQAIGAQLAFPNRQVVALCGDGGLAMGLGDLLSLRQLELPVKVIVYRNDSLAFVELEMKAAGLLDFATDLINPDFTQIAEASGIKSYKITKPEQVESAIENALDFKGPAMVEVAVARQEISMPPTITREQATGLGIFMAKAVLDGRGNEVIDLAKTNLLR